MHPPAPTVIQSRDLLTRLRAGERQALDELYLDHRNHFISWAGRRFPQLNNADLSDAFQEAVICFYENAVSGRLRELRARPRTYLYLIGERRCRAFAKSRSRTVKILDPASVSKRSELDPSDFIPPDDLPPDDPFGILADTATNARMLEEVSSALRRLRPDCRELLTAFYYQGLTLAEMCEEFGYRDRSVTSTRKSQCLARLRELCRSLW